MPSCPRAEIVRLGAVAVYHCWNRCVRRAYLCGKDLVTGIDYEYRRDWICAMQENLARLFGIEIGFRAELSTHIHLILRTRPDVVEAWSDQEVVRRWLVASKLAKSSDDCFREPHPAGNGDPRTHPETTHTPVGSLLVHGNLVRIYLATR